MIVKKDNVERIIGEDELSIFAKLGFTSLDKNKPEVDAKKLTDMTVPELKALAKEKGIDNADSLNKAELLKVLSDTE